ncbi:hypothetical protein [Pinirhizobacter soli]|uniref:hypothetical protein n=1 Tax=Pinirhizobacter soli TaxID=2786953 RepID=UPI00202AAC62|nr:hypothetical protein [Pinirhizobacter soli]
MAFDDDEKGRKVSRDIAKKWMFSDEDKQRRILLFKDCPGIEGAFGREDFAALVSPGLAIFPDKSVSHAVKIARLSRPMLALCFHGRVAAGEITREMVSKDTCERFAGWLESLSK